MRAAKVIQSWPGYGPTPLQDLRQVAAGCRVGRVWYKDEATRFGLGSFKALGGAYAVFRVLELTTQPVTVTTATDGNHGRSVAWGAQMFACRAVIFIPKGCSVGRERAIASYGARVMRTSAGYDDTVRECARVALAEGYQVISDTSWRGYTDIPRLVMQGYTVMVQEALDQMAPEKPTHIFVQAGVGGPQPPYAPMFGKPSGASGPGSSWSNRKVRQVCLLRLKRGRFAPLRNRSTH